MASAICEALPPTSVQVVNGRRVYRSEHMVSTMNDTGSDILYNVEAIMFDSLGHRGTASARDVVAPGSGSSASGPYVVDFDASLFPSGVEVQFTCETHVTAGLSAVDRKVNQITTE
jgi:hypothetical protein